MINTRTPRFLLLLAGALLSACSSSNLPPWQDADRYPDHEYLRADGSGENPEIARQRALANLSQIFQVQIRDQSSDFSHAEVKNGQKADTLQRSNRSIETSSQQLLEGARIAELWRDDDGRHYALAVLDKEKAIDSLNRRIRQLDSEAGRAVNRAEQATEPLVSFSALEMARQALKKRQQLAQKLLILDSPPPPTALTIGIVESKIQTAFGELQVGVQSADPALRRLLEGALSNLGATLQAAAPYRLHAELGLEPIKWEQGWFWQRGSLELRLDHAGTTLALQRWPVKASATDDTLLAERLSDQLAGALPDRLYQLLTRAGSPEQNDL